MATLVLRNSKGSPLTFAEVDANFTNLNNELATKTTSGSIVNADINASAAIAYSKLNLASSIVNADISSSAAIAGSKVNPNFGVQTCISNGYTAGTGAVTGTYSWQSVELGNGATSGSTLIDLKCDSTYTDYGLRVARSEGANGNSVMTHRGTGILYIQANDGGNARIALQTNSTDRLNVYSSGHVSLSGYSSGAGGQFSCDGYQSRSGTSGSFSTNLFNIHWNGTPQLYIDTTNVGTFAFTSDYRIKQNVIDAPISGISTINALRPVEYEYQDSPDFPGMFQPDGVRRLGFIAHEAQQVHPSLVEGGKDEPNRVQSLRIDAILAATVKALQEAVERIETLEAQVAALAP